MAQIVSHNPASVHAPSSGYSMGLELGQHRRLLFISGQVPEKPDGSVPEGFASKPGATSSRSSPQPASASGIWSRSLRF
jgi:enamine deaminase RidA (YjgF/YER057c/UK114 family)